MTKQEFIENLRIALNGKVSPGQVTENMRYYEDYINVEIRKGRSEEEVLAALGDPRLIARTIVGTRNEKDGGDQTPPKIFFRIPIWLWLVFALLIVVLILGVVFSVITALLPILLPVFGILFLWKWFRGRKG